MSTTKFDPVSFADVVDKIKNDEIVLPDFQRGFVWRDKNKQKALIASILTRIPIGSLLLLGAEGNTFRYKKIGMRNTKPEVAENKQVGALIDGQQRITVLVSFLTDELGSIGDEQDFASATLKRRYFLKFYPLNRLLNSPEEDLFGVIGFQPAREIVESTYPMFSTDQIKDKIDYFDKSEDEVLVNTSNCDPGKLNSFCLDHLNDAMLLPLYYLYGSATKKNTNHRNRFRSVMKEIAKRYVNECLLILKQLNNEKEMALTLAEKSFREKELENVKKDIENDSQELRNEESELYRNVLKNLEYKADSWSDYVSEYLESCVSKMELYEIKVEGSNIERAIDIYQNLNLGGKSLDIFDLLLARAALDDDNRNLLETVKDYVSSDHRDDYAILCNLFPSDAAVISYKGYIDDLEEYSASLIMGAFDKDEQLTPTFCNILMSLAGTLYCLLDEESNIIKDKAEKITSQCTKSDQLLSIGVEKIRMLINKALVGLDRACFFLQVKCGIRTLSETKYKLLVVIIAVILSQDNWYRNSKVISCLDAWYWAVLFSGGFRIEQNKAFQESLRKLIPFLCDCADNDKVSPDFILSLCNRTFCDNRYNTENILLLNNNFVEVDSSISDIICQYYLSLTYPDILKEGYDEKYKQDTISVFSTYGRDAVTLHMHHIMPIGSLEAKYKSMDKLKRDDKFCKYNSPLNMILISDKSNRIILNSTLRNYVNYCDTNALNKVGLTTSISQTHIQNEDEKDIEMILKERFVSLCSSLRSHYAKCLGIQEIQIEDFYEKSRQN